MWVCVGVCMVPCNGLASHHAFFPPVFLRETLYLLWRFFFNSLKCLLKRWTYVKVFYENALYGHLSQEFTNRPLDCHQNWVKQDICPYLAKGGRAEFPVGGNRACNTDRGMKYSSEETRVCESQADKRGTGEMQLGLSFAHFCLPHWTAVQLQAPH